MGDQDHGALEGRQRLGERLAHLQVQVVGGLIQQQQVGLLPGHQGQRQARLLAAGEAPHLAEDVVTREAEAAQEVADRLVAGGGREALHMHEGGGREVEPLQLVLGEVADRQVLAGHPLAGQQRQLAGERLDQGRLAGAVGAQQADAASRLQGHPDVVELHRLAAVRVAIAQPRLVQHQQRVRGLVRGGQGEVEGRVGVGHGDVAHALEHLQAALGGAGLGGLGTEACHEALDLLAARLLLGGLGLLQRQLLGPGALEGGVVAAVEHQAAAVEVDDVVAHRVEEVAVVGDQQQGARVAGQPLL